jgi:hypothetical protein
VIVRRGALTDHFVEDDRSVVMVDESVLGLSPIATAILEAVPVGTEVSLQALTDHVVAIFGPPDHSQSASSLTRQQVWDLVAHNVLVVVEDEQPVDRPPAATRERPGDLPRGEPDEAVTALRDALRHLRSDTPGRWVAPDSLGPEALVRAARQHHVVPYLGAHLDRLALPDGAGPAIDVAAGRQRAGAALLAADLSVALAALTRAGVPALAFKGVALAAQAYGDYAARGAGDLDLLVAPTEVARAHEALTAAGWRPAPACPVPGPSWAWRHLVQSGNELTLIGDRSEIDLHWDLSPVRGTFPSFETLWERREIVTVAERPVPTLSAYDALAHSAGHAAKDEWRWLRSMLDVHVLAAAQAAWLAVDRPLRTDQLLTLGLVVHEFGLPPGAPPVAALAAQRVGASRLRRVRLHHERTAPRHQPRTVPGHALLSLLRTAWLTDRSFTQVALLLRRSAFPPWLTADLDSPKAVVAVPTILARRTREVGAKAARSVSALLGVPSGQGIEHTTRRSR